MQHVEVLPGSLWLERMVSDTRRARTWKAVSFAFDDLEVKRALLERLRSPSEFECTIVVDERAHKARTTRGQLACLRELQAAGAKVLLAGGNNALAKQLFGRNCFGGQMHQKAVLVDDEIAFVGSANLTRQSRCNRELMCRIVGSSVPDILAEISATIAAAPESRV